MFDQVEADYDQLTQVANRFAVQAQATEQMMRQVQAKISNLENGGWIGRGSDAFFAEMNQDVIPAIQRLSQALGEANRATNQIAQTMQQAEEDASSRFCLVGI